MHTIRKFALVGASVFAISTPAYGQQAEPGGQEASSLANAIVVTARRREESIQDVPLSIQAVGGDNLQDLEIRKLEDVASVVPGLSLESGENGIGGQSSLRGVNFDARASGAATSVEFYRNDAVISQGALFQALYDIGRIEVLRGPQGTLRGRASPSGSINLTTQRPILDEAGGYLSGTLAEDSKWNLNGALNLPIIGGKLGARLAGFVGSSRGNEVRGLNLVTGEIDSDIYDRTEALRASLRADPLDGILILDFNYETISRNVRMYDQVQSFSTVEPTAGPSPTLITQDDRLGIGALPNRNFQDYKIYNWQGQLNLFGQSLTYLGAKLDSTILAFAPQDAAGVLGEATDGNLPFVQDTVSRNDQTTHEIRLQNQERVAGLFDYVVGYMQIKADTPTIFNGNTAIAVPTTPPFAELTRVVYTPRFRFRSDKEESFFGNLTLHIGERTEISGGLRSIRFKADSGLRVDTTGDPDPNNWREIDTLRRCYGHAEIPGCLPTKKATIYSASATHHFTDDLMVYASYGTSFRPGNSVIGYSGTPGEFLSQFLNLPDEKSKSYEVGLKSSWLNNRLRFNISGYYQEFSNYPFFMETSVLTVNGTSAADAVLISPDNFVAPVDAKVKGFEADLAFDVSDNFNLLATVAFADGEIKNGRFPCVDLDDDNVPDTTVPSAAEYFNEVGLDQVDICVGNASPGSSARWSGSVAGEYSQEVAMGVEGYLRGLLAWKGDSAGDGINPYDSVKSYALLDLFAGVRHPDGAWEVSLFAKNILGTDRVLSRDSSPRVTTFRQAGGPTLGPTSATNFVLISTTLPREFGVSARIAFGSR